MLLELLNVIKAQSDTEWLTQGQRLGSEKVFNALHVPGWYNLTGPAGSGKTFCGWLLSRGLDAPMLNGPYSLLSFASRHGVRGRTLIIDNGPEDVSTLRWLLTEMQLLEVRCALVITRQTNELNLSTAHLPMPTHTDREQIAERLRTYYPFSPTCESSNLWTWILSTFDE